MIFAGIYTCVTPYEKEHSITIIVKKAIDFYSNFDFLFSSNFTYVDLSYLGEVSENRIDRRPQSQPAGLIHQTKVERRG